MPSRLNNSIMGKSISNNTVLKIVIALFLITLLLFFLIRTNKCTENFNVNKTSLSDKIKTTGNLLEETKRTKNKLAAFPVPKVVKK